MADARDTDKRPDPDALLALSDQGRGRLKIFLGAAPGVGKTYAMLQAAARLRSEGQEVVVGLVETHGRAETQALVTGLEMLPRRKLTHRGVALEEFDLDAALARHPRLMIVDELAHTNAPDSRHPKRWQDVKELLAAGIDVWTALNIQHLESLADVVAHITGITVRETVPDTILRTAADVVLVDITPDELITRLKSGKVYRPQTAKRATEKFFTSGNLTALRELALRQTADRVDDQMTEFLRQKAIEGPWGASERLLACLGADKGSELLVRKTSRLANSLNAGWIAVHLTRPERDAPEADRKSAEILRLAETLGVQVVFLVVAVLALDRVQLVGEAVKVAALQENENIRDALLSSLSHDLRTPLSLITGAVTSLRQLHDQPEDQRQDLLLAIDQEVVYNLLDNAHKYGGGGAVSVQSRDDGLQVVISVTDDGPGIAAGDLERVFEKFYRAGGADGRKSGTGLGLSICRGLVAAMDGTVTAESPAARHKAGGAAARRRLAGWDGPMTRLRVLVVDDEPQIQSLLRIALGLRAMKPCPPPPGATACGSLPVPRLMRSFWIWACPIWTARTSSATSAPFPRCR